MTPPSWPAATLPGPSALCLHDGAGPPCGAHRQPAPPPRRPAHRRAGRGGSQVLDVRHCERQEACSPAGRAAGRGAAARACRRCGLPLARGEGVQDWAVCGCCWSLSHAVGDRWWSRAWPRPESWPRTGSGSRSPLCWQASCWPPAAPAGPRPGRRGRGAQKARAHRPADSSAMAKNAALSAAGTAIPRGFG